MRAPAFWDDRRSPLSRALAPLGWIYAGATALRLSCAHPWRAPIPVICVGNLTAGGTGKTPVVREIARLLKARGLSPAILSRGYGGQLGGPLQVDPDRYSAAETGDEPLMLARNAACWIAADRADGARAIARSGAAAIIMDDGLQNPRLAQDLRLIVADGALGFGNRRGIPAGPLRETVAAGIRRADAMIVMGADEHQLAEEFSSQLPVLRARLTLTAPAALWGRRVLAFAGIGSPGKFHKTLSDSGAQVAGFHSFPDHHEFTQAELNLLRQWAQALDAMLLTTEKDWVRLDYDWRARVAFAPVAVRWDDEDAIVRLLDEVLGFG